MSDLLIFAAFVLFWYLLQTWLLPRMGVPT
jgi:hypothetical protein